MRPGGDRHLNKIGVILGLGLDGTDGHTRVTTGENFYLLGGSQDTHEVMQDKVSRFNDKLHERGKALGEIGPDEFKELAHESGMI